jgi:hypothetical protein
MLSQHDEWKLDDGYDTIAEQELERLSDLNDLELFHEVINENGQDLPPHIRETMETYVYEKGLL